ncbi:hypothetical protein Leryth_012061 [Lithospermum erythrorhizon]|nr:hypothetical protein Leryth_012061 [Lithospermum erythrorhizon]
MSKSNINYSKRCHLCKHSENEEKIVYCKYCGKDLHKSGINYKEQSDESSCVLLGRDLLVDMVGWIGRIELMCNGGRFDAVEILLKEKNEEIAQFSDG